MKRSALFLFVESEIYYAQDHFYSQVAYIVESEFELMDINEAKSLKSGNCIYVEPLKKRS